MPISGALCTSTVGWPAVYYILGGFTIIFFVLFICFYRDDPAEHCNVSKKELGTIKAGRINTGEHPAVPYKRIVLDLPVIGIIVSCFGGSLGLQIMVRNTFWLLMSFKSEMAEVIKRQQSVLILCKSIFYILQI